MKLKILISFSCTLLLVKSMQAASNKNTREELDEQTVTQLPFSWNPGQWIQQPASSQLQPETIENLQSLFSENTPEKTISLTVDENNCVVKVTEKFRNNVRLLSRTTQCPTTIIRTTQPKISDDLLRLYSVGPTEVKQTQEHTSASEVTDLLNGHANSNIFDDDDDSKKEPLDSSPNISIRHDAQGCEIKTITSREGVLTKIRTIKTCPTIRVQSRNNFADYIHATLDTKIQSTTAPTIEHFERHNQPMATTVRSKSAFPEPRESLNKEISTNMPASTFKNLTFEAVDVLPTHELPNLPHYDKQPSLNPLSTHSIKPLPTLTLANTRTTTMKPSGNINIIDSFLAQLGVTSNDITQSRNGELIKTIIDNNGRILTVSLVLSTVMGSAEAPSAKEIKPIRYTVKN